jgi:hypothetical protein
VPEVIASGFIVDTLDEMVEAVKRIDVIDRAICRRHVEARCTVQRMADDYERICRHLLVGARPA